MTKSFEDWSNDPGTVMDLRGEPLTPELIQDAFDLIKHNRGRAPERILSLRQFQRAKVLAKKFEDGTITADERFELSALTGV